MVSVYSGCRNVLSRIYADPNAKIILVILLIALTYLGIFSNQFLMNDYALSSDWPVIEGASDAGSIFVSESQSGTYLPLKMLFHALHFRLWGLDAFGYHVVALLFHLLSVVLVYRISILLTRHSGMALLTALFFGLHPVQVESVAGIVISMDLLGALLFFTAFWLYLEAVDDPAEKGLYPLSLVFGLMAVFSGTMAMALPLVILLYEVCLRQKPDVGGHSRWRAAFRGAWPYFAIVVFYALVKWMVSGTLFSGSWLADSPYLTVLVMIKALARYIVMPFWPLHLSTDHILSHGIFSHTPSDFSRSAVLFQSIFDVRVLLSLAVIGIAGYGAVNRFRREPLVSFGIGWFLLGLLPVLTLISQGIYFGERYFYIPLFGFCLLISYWLYRFYEKNPGPGRKQGLRWLILTAVSVLIVFYIVKTDARSRQWTDDITFYQAEAQANPQSSLTQANLGVMYLQFGLYDEAIASLEKAIQLNPPDPHNYFSMAEAYMEQDRYIEAIKFLEDAIQAKADFAEAYINLAVAYEALELSGVAKEYLNKGLALYEQQGRTEEAAALEETFEDYFGKAGQD